MFTLNFILPYTIYYIYKLFCFILDVVKKDNVEKSKSHSLNIKCTGVLNKRNKAKSKENVETKMKKNNCKSRNKQSASLKKLISLKLDNKVDNLCSNVESPIKDESFEDFQCDIKKVI